MQGQTYARLSSASDFAQNDLGLLLKNERKDVVGAEKANRAAGKADPGGYATAHRNMERKGAYEEADGTEKASFVHRTRRIRAYRGASMSI